MAVIGIKKLSELEGANRIDADYYQPELELIKKNIQAIGKPLKYYISYIKHPVEIKRLYETDGMPYILAENISKYFWILQFLKERYIPEEKAQLIPQNKLEKGDVLVTRTGANYGDACVYLGEPTPAYASAHMIIIRPSKISGEFLAAYFNTSYGKKLIKRGCYGSSQPEISPTYMITLPVPRLNVETEVTALVRDAYSLMSNSKDYFSQAEKILLEELALKDFKANYELSYTANLSQAYKANRLDAEYFQPLYQHLIDYLINNYDAKPLKIFLVGLQKGVEVGSDNYQEDGKPFVRVSSLSKNGFIDNNQKYIDEELYQKLREIYKPQTGDFLITKDANPGIAFVVKEPIEGIISSGILKLIINDNMINSEYLALCVNSLPGKIQIERDGGGSIIIHWKPGQVKTLQIPILPIETQQKISLLVQQSFEARKQAMELLECAKVKVEKAIENKTK